MARNRQDRRIEPTFGRAKRSGGRKKRGRGAGEGGLFRRLFYWSMVLAVWAGVGLGGLFAWYAADLPSISDLKIPKRLPNVTVVDVHGGVLGERGLGQSRAVRLNDLPPHLPQAVIAIEDRRFYSHIGVDMLGLARAMARNVMSGRLVEGGSTLTQQLAKNLFLTPDRTISRKVQEMILAMWLEANYDKNDILELYLNRVYFGAGTYGIDAAAERFFNKPARNVTLPEAAILAGLLKAPTRYAPTRNPDLAEDRAYLVLNAMVEEGYITRQEGQEAVDRPARPAARGGLNSANYVADYVSDLLPSFVGSIERDIVVETSVDGGLQAMAEAAVRNVLDEEGKPARASQAALISIDGNGAIRAMVGGRSYAESQFNRAVKAQRQPGSAFKPFVYLAALESGRTPDDVVVDEPVRFGKWSPSNYDNKYAGRMSMRDALAKSVNTVAAKLARESGVGNVIRVAQRLGIASPLRSDLSLALGTSEVNLLEMTGAFVPLSNGGYGVLPYVIERIRTADGKQVLYQRDGSGPGPVIDPYNVAAMNDMLQGALQFGTGRRAAFGGWPAAGKTGTTQDWKDAWFIGYTAYLTTGVWIGNDDGTPMKRVSGGTLPAMTWNRFMSDAHEGLAVASLPGAQYASREPVFTGSTGGADPSAPIVDSGGMRITADFLKRIFGQ